MVTLSAPRTSTKAFSLLATSIVIASGVTLLVAEPAEAAVSQLNTSGPLTRILTDHGLRCQVLLNGTGQYFSSSTVTNTAACGTSIKVNATVYRGWAGAVELTPVSGPTLTGSGTASDPYLQTIVADAGSSGVRVTQVERYVVGDLSYQVDVSLSSTATTDLSVAVYRAVDCMLGAADSGYGYLNISTATVACTQTAHGASGQVELFRALSPGAKLGHGHYYTDVYEKARAGIQFSDTCLCTTHLDNGAGISWAATLPAGGNLTYSLIQAFSSNGVQTVLREIDTPPTCTQDQYLSGNTCVNHTTCTAAEYESAAPNATANRQCSGLTTCSEDEYESVAPTSTSDRVCTALTVCGAGQQETVAANATADRQCEDLDSDGDGLSDILEAEFGTDPHNPDSDGDGYSDGDKAPEGTNLYTSDNCPTVANGGQEDTVVRGEFDDGSGDACDADGDGMSDAGDACPSFPDSLMQNASTNADGDDSPDDCDAKLSLDDGATTRYRTHSATPNPGDELPVSLGVEGNATGEAGDQLRSASVKLGSDLSALDGNGVIIDVKVKMGAHDAGGDEIDAEDLLAKVPAGDLLFIDIDAFLMNAEQTEIDVGSVVDELDITFEIPVSWFTVNGINPRAGALYEYHDSGAGATFVRKLDLPDPTLDTKGTPDPADDVYVYTLTITQFSSFAFGGGGTFITTRTGGGGGGGPVYGGSCGGQTPAAWVNGVPAGPANQALGQTVQVRAAADGNEVRWTAATGHVKVWACDGTWTVRAAAHDAATGLFKDAAGVRATKYVVELVAAPVATPPAVPSETTVTPDGGNLPASGNSSTSHAPAGAALDKEDSPTPWRWIGLLVLATVGLLFLLAWRRRKKDDEDQT